MRRRTALRFGFARKFLGAPGRASGRAQKLDKSDFLQKSNFLSANPLKSLKIAKEIFGKT
jgi:hypothetical protein